MNNQQKRVLIVITIAALIAPVFVVTDAAAVAPGYRVYGYVMKTGTTTPISGALVKVSNDGVYLGSTTTSSSGYFSYSTTRKPTYYDTGWEVWAIKGGYIDAFKFAAPDPSGITNMGTVYMSPVPPPPQPPPAPIISNVQRTKTGFTVTLSWSVSWGAGSTSYHSMCWWSRDSTIDSSDLIYDTYQGMSSYSVTVPRDRVPYYGGTCWYKIYALNAKPGASSETYYGPATTDMGNVWKPNPTKDAYTDNDNYNYNYNTGEIHATSLYDTTAWLGFQIDCPWLVTSATLHAYCCGTESQGHGTITVYVSGTNWAETGITYNYAQTYVPIGQAIASVSSGSSGAWDVWDVTRLAGSTSTISICLKASGGQSVGAYYYSRDYGNPSLRPYIEAQYENRGGDGVVNKWAVIVGISDYKAVNDLQYCDEDATDWYNYLYGVLGYNNIRVLGDEHTSNYPTYYALATETNAKASLTWLAGADADDVVAFITSGHGNGDGYGSSYLCMWDSGSGENGQDGNLYDTELDDYVGSWSAARIFIFIDNCFSGGLIPEIAALPNHAHVYMTTTCTQNGYGYDDPPHLNGAWTYYFLDYSLKDHFHSIPSWLMEDNFDYAIAAYPHSGGDTPQEYVGNTSIGFALTL